MWCWASGRRSSFASRSPTSPDAETVLYNTGDGLKTLDAVAAASVPTVTIAPSYSAFAKSGVA